VSPLDRPSCGRTTRSYQDSADVQEDTYPRFVMMLVITFVSPRGIADMALEAIAVGTLDELYTFVESAVARTAFILDHDALYRPWAGIVSSSCTDVRWLYPAKPLSDAVWQHLENFAHVSLNERMLVLLEHGRVIKAIDLDAVDGRSQPHLLSAVIQNAFKPKRDGASMGRGFSGNPFVLLGVYEADSNETISKRYKQLIMDYHPDRVAHLGQELKDLASKKTTEINAAFAAIRRIRKI
jgi:DnaJ domain